MPSVVVAIVVALAPATSSTTEAVPRIVGEPLPSWVVLAASAALLVAIVVAGALVNRRLRASGRPR